MMIDKAINMEHDKWNKEKVTVTLSPEVLRKVDRWSNEMHLRSRSAALERLLEQSIEKEDQRQLEAETEAYYLSLSKEERNEDRSWTKSSSSQAIRRFDKKGS